MVLLKLFAAGAGRRRRWIALVRHDPARLTLPIGGQARLRCANRLSDSVRQDLKEMDQDTVAAWSVWLLFSIECERDRMRVYSHHNHGCESP